MKRAAAHVYWTRPRRPDERPYADFEAVALAVSCLMWRRHHGPVTLFTDPRGLAHLDRMGVLPFWDGIDTGMLAGVPDTIRADVFWDIGKAFVLAELPAGSCVLDLDLIVWQRLELPADAVGFLHWERPARPWYPGPDELAIPPGYAFDADLDWNGPVGNTAFMTAGDARFRKTFAAEALRFALGNDPGGTGIGEMLFAGQRLFVHLCRKLGLRPHPLADHLYDPHAPDAGPSDPLALSACERGSPFTHLWRHKWHLLRDRAVAGRFRAWLIRRCLELAPEAAPRLAELEKLRGG